MAPSEERLINISYRASMRSEYAAHYHLTTDLSTGAVQRRLRGNWMDRFKTWWYNREYKRWEKTVNNKRHHKVLIDSNNLTPPRPKPRLPDPGMSERTY